MALASTMVGDLPQEVGRCAIVDRDQHDALDQGAPQRGDPFGPVLTPDRDRLSAHDAALSQLCGERGAWRASSRVGPRPGPISIVEREELRTIGRVGAIGGDVREEVEERTPRHEGEL